MQLELIQDKIYNLRDQKVMFDFDLATLYQVETRVLKQAVRRNLKRFPDDFMFVLTDDEINTMVSQNVIPSKKHLGGAAPFAFTEQGVSMLSSVVRSDVAIAINISIIRAFVQLRQLALSHSAINKKLSEIETRYDKQFKSIYEALDYLLKKDNKELQQKERKQIGYK